LEDTPDFRAALRSDEADTLDFNVNSAFINADDFLVADNTDDGIPFRHRLPAGPTFYGEAVVYGRDL